MVKFIYISVHSDKYKIYEIQYLLQPDINNKIDMDLH